MWEILMKWKTLAFQGYKESAAWELWDYSTAGCDEPWIENGGSFGRTVECLKGVDIWEGLIEKRLVYLKVV